MVVSAIPSLNEEAARLIRCSRAAAGYLATGQFRELWDGIRRRESSRRNLLRLLPKSSVGAELGVFKGAFSAEILRRVVPKELHLVDMWWEAFGEFYPDWGRYTDFGRLRTRAAYKHAVRVATEANYGNAAKLVFHVGDDLAYLRTFPDGYFDWVYIDTSHEYAHTAAELALAAIKVRAGGLICGDDWTEEKGHPHAGVARAVKEFLADHALTFELKYLRCGQWLIGPPVARA
jgi:Methyltransferase domain